MKNYYERALWRMYLLGVVLGIPIGSMMTVAVVLVLRAVAG